MGNVLAATGGPTVRVVVPFPPGGPTDIVARVVCQALSEQLGRTYVVENKPGASGMIGANIVAKAKPDGTTLLMNVSAHVVNPLLYEKALDDPLEDFAPITQLAHTPIQLVVSADSPYQTMDELVSSLKQDPDKHAFASSSIGAPGHLTGELFKQAIGKDIVHVPYKGSAPALTDVISGQVTYMFDSMPSSISFVRSGKLRALGVSAQERVSSIPDVPTFAEQGYSSLNLSTWYGLWAPAGTSDELVQQVYAAVKKVLETPSVIELLDQVQAYPAGETPAEFDAFCRSETERYAEIIKAAGITPV